MNFSELEDSLASLTSEHLSSASITVHRRRVKGALDPSTRTRTIEVDAKAETVDAISSPRIPVRDDNGRSTVVTTWTVLASDLTFLPSTDGLVVDEGDGSQWRISRVERVLEGRQYDLHCARIG